MNTEISKVTRRVHVWDLATRAIHWALVLLIPFLWWSERNDHMEWHVKAGIGVASLLVMRLFLGFFGAETSRFSQFMHGPREAWAYVRGKSGKSAGHNPIGGWSVMALLSLLVAETVLGLFASDEDGLDSGPFADYLSADHARFASYLHGQVFQVLVVVICVHIVAIALYLASGQNLVGPMLTGVKRLPPELRVPKLASPVVIVGGLVLAAATFVVLWRLDGF